MIFFQEGEECCVWQVELKRQLPTRNILWIHDSVTPDGGSDHYFSPCVTLMTKIWISVCTRGGGLGTSAIVVALARAHRNLSEFLLGMWNAHNGTCTPTSESLPPICRDQSELDKITQNGHDYNKCPPFPPPLPLLSSQWHLQYL